MCAVLAFSGCGAKSSTGTMDMAAQSAPQENASVSMMEETVSEAEIGSADGAGAAQTDQTQKLIQDIYANVICDNPSEALETILSEARSMGGYLLSSHDNYDEEENSGYASLQIRLPAGNDAQFKTFLQQVGDLSSYNSQSYDVTNTYYDLQTRIEQGKQELEQLNALLASCKSVEEVLAVRAQISTVQSDVESMQGEFKRLSELTSYDTISIDLEPHRNMVPGGSNERLMTGSEFWTGIQYALQDSVRTLINGGGKLLIAFAGILLPLAAFAVVVLVIVWICIGASRRSKKRRMRKMQAQQNTRADS
jgi:hypothetical protein